MNGMAMMLKSMGVDMESIQGEIDAKVNEVKLFGQQIHARVGIIEQRLENMETKLDALIELQIRAEQRGLAMQSNVISAGDDGLHLLTDGVEPCQR